MRDEYMRRSEAFLLIYSITDPSSFQDIEQIHEQLLRSIDEDQVPIVVIGNKSDLEEERGVSREEGKRFAKQIRASFFETSARFGTNIDIAYRDLVNQVLLTRKGENNYENQTNEGEEILRKQNKKKQNKYCIMM
jgi:small GTP-binding protein